MVSFRSVRSLAASVVSVIVALGLFAGPAVADDDPTPLVRQHFHHLEAEAKAQRLTALRKAPRKLSADQGLYDALRYELELDLDPPAQMLQGRVTCVAEVAGAGLDTLTLDLFDDMVVSAVEVDEVAANFDHADDRLRVDLGSTRAVGDTLRVTVDYAGSTVAQGAFQWDSYGGEPLIWTLSEPYGAPEWWPCKDTPADKADRVDLWVTVPDGLVVASNGSLLSETVDAGQRTFHWRENYPITTYLVSLAIHPYQKIQDSWEYEPGQTMPVVHYVVGDEVAAATSGFAVTVPMLEAFRQGFGLYPFVEEKYGHAQFPWPGGMEHQTLTSLWYNTYGEWIIAHELAHQWWGDLVTCADFHHIWLNEGLATWSEAYWRELSVGFESYQTYMAAIAYFGAGSIYVEDATDESAIFDTGLSYYKGAWVIHMLRGVLGDTDFFASLQAWRTQYAHDSGTTEDFQAVCEQVSGRDLSWFFQQWIYGELYPQYDYSWYGVAEGDSTAVRVLIEQTQATEPFTMPLELEIRTDEGTFRRTVLNDAAEQLHVVTVTGTVEDVILDPDDWVLDQSSGTATAAPGAALAKLHLGANHPNPFNPRTTIAFELPRRMPARLSVLDVAGRRVRVLRDGVLEAGPHAVVWDGRDARGRPVTSGVYFYRLLADGTARTGKMALVR